MKAFKILLAVAAMTLPAVAQQVVGPATKSGFSVSTVVVIPGITTSNLPTTLAQAMPVGANGIGFSINVAGTNATTTTNATVTLEGTINGTEWIDVPTTALPVLSVPQNGTTEQTYYTNILALTAASQNIGNIRSLRIKSIQNTNTASIFFTNFISSAR